MKQISLHANSLEYTEWKKAIITIQRFTVKPDKCVFYVIVIVAFTDSRK